MQDSSRSLESATNKIAGTESYGYPTHSFPKTVIERSSQRSGARLPARRITRVTRTSGLSNAVAGETFIIPIFGPEADRGPLKDEFDRIHASYLGLNEDGLLKALRVRAGLSAPGEYMGS